MSAEAGSASFPALRQEGRSLRRIPAPADHSGRAVAAHRTPLSEIDGRHDHVRIRARSDFLTGGDARVNRELLRVLHTRGYELQTVHTTPPHLGPIGVAVKLVGHLLLSRAEAA